MEQKYVQRKSIPRNSLVNYDEVNQITNQNLVNNKTRFWQKLAKNWDKYVYTFCILFCYLTYGLCSTLFPPAMVDMKFLFRTSMANITYCNTFGSVGYLTGSLTGFLYKYINRQFTFVIAIVALGVFTAAEPFCTSLWQLYISFFLNTVGGGIFDSGNSVWVVEMWNENSAPVLLLSQAMYGCGTIVAPLIMKPFVYGDLSNRTNGDTTGTPTTTEMTTLSTLFNTTVLMNSTSDDDINYSVNRRPKLIIPYMIGGGLVLIVPVILLVMLFVKRYEVPKNRIQDLRDKNALDQAINADPSKVQVEVSPTTRKILIALVALSLNSYAGLEIIHFNYSSTYYQYLPIHLSASTAATVMAVMTSTYAGGRAVSAFISSKVSAEIMLLYHMVILCISMTVLYFGKNSETIIYVGNAIIGFGFSAMWPSYFSFSEKYIKLTDKVTSIYSFTSALFALSAPFIIGPLIEKKPEVFIDFEIGLLGLTIILYMIIMVTLKRSQRYPILYTVNSVITNK